MRLFIVIYIVGQVGGTVGPLPYGLEECERRAAEMLSRGNPDVTTPNGLTIKDVRVACEWHRDRPKNEYRP